MAGIFINYRRDDSPGVAGRLFDYLALKYSRNGIFMDVDAMKPGMDFAVQLDSQVSQCRVLLAVIGPRWLDAKDHAGHRRLDSDRDYVRIELASALKRDIPVIPVLVDGAAMPDEDSLSDDLKPLARRHALELRHTRFNADADAIMHALEGVVPRRQMTWPIVGAAAAVVMVAVAVGAVLWPKLSAKLHPAAVPQVAMSPTPPAQTPPAVSLPSAAPPIAPSQQQAVLPPAPAPSPPAPHPALPAPASAAPAASLPPGVKLGEMMQGVTLPGSVYRSVDQPQADPAACQAACRADTYCAAWTLSEARGPTQPARCTLKPLIPEQVANTCCTSGIERAPEPAMREPPLVPAAVVGAQSGIDYFGGDYRGFGGAQVTPESCEATCKAETNCVAWTYVRAGILGTAPHCALKSKIPPPIKSACCISGIEPQAVAHSGAPMVNTDLRGSSYRNFELPADSWSLCQSACKTEPQCLAWTSVHPGLQGPNARCWLKNKIPPATANLCCTSGIERAESQ
ncbi:MAG TPA: PAN domain-containing protein [Steroidobacteraceae bacterium]|nr:PAN domain-containing protein [Steroidobacteraceae bacterium]